MKEPFLLLGHCTCLLRLLAALVFCAISANINLLDCHLPPSAASHDHSPHTICSLKALHLDGHFAFHETQLAAVDFGNYHRYHPPLAVLWPGSPADIAATIRHVSRPRVGGLTVAARGRGHSLQGQAGAPGGVVVSMERLGRPPGRRVIQHCRGRGAGAGGEAMIPCVDVGGGELWIDVLEMSLGHGLAPRSWTDYLHLTVGGTLSNAGISGQAFRHGPQISNVHQLQIVTGRGEVVTCSEEHNSDLFYGALGGLGQFGIITRAKISLEKAPKKVKWIRVLYSNFPDFAKDQELLISSKLEHAFDYIEGFVMINRTSILQNWGSSFTAHDPVGASSFSSDGKILFCMELAKYYDPETMDIMNKEVKSLLSHLGYIPSTLFTSDVTFREFLDRVHKSEMEQRSKGQWEVPHPWLVLFIPRSRIHYFADQVFGRIVKNSGDGPILIYPVNKSKWDNRTSAVIPEENTFYLVAFLSSALSSSGPDMLQHLLSRNKRVLDFCKENQIGAKQYLPHYTTSKDWEAHFGPQWETFFRRKSAYDPLAILAPMHRIFHRQPQSQSTASHTFAIS